jgi:hypothetical protein
MTSLMRIILVTSTLILPLGGCASVGDAIDPTDWFSGELFNTKKKLPGDRKAVFPEGVPGVTQGIPSELVKGNQQPPLENGYTVTDIQSVSPPPRQATGKTAAKTAAKTDATRTDATRTDATNADTAKTDEYQPAPREKAKPKPKPKPATAERQPAAQERQPAAARRAPEPQQAEQPQRSQQAGSSGGGVQWPDPPAPRGGSQSGGGVQWPDPPPMR